MCAEAQPGAIADRLKDEGTYQAQYLISNYHRAVQEALKVAEFDEALESATDCLSLAREAFGDENPIVASAHNNVGLVKKRMGQWSEALTSYMEAVRVYEAALGPTHASTATAFTNLAILHRERAELDGDIDADGIARAKEDALAYAEEALSRREKALEPSDPDIAMALMNVAAAHRILGGLRLAKRHLDRAMPILEKALPKGHPYVATCCNNLGLVLKGLGDTDEAMRLYQRALDAREAAFGETHPDTLVVMHNIAELLGSMGKEEEANRIRSAILERQNKRAEATRDPNERYVEQEDYDSEYDD